LTEQRIVKILTYKLVNTATRPVSACLFEMAANIR